MSVVRAEPVPVVDLGALLGGRGGDISRFVTIRSQVGRPFMLGVSEVLGIRDMPLNAIAELPRMLGAEAAALASALAADDQRVVSLLETARLVPSDVWDKLRTEGARRR